MYCFVEYATSWGRHPSGVYILTDITSSTFLDDMTASRWFHAPKKPSDLWSLVTDGMGGNITTWLKPTLGWENPFSFRWLKPTILCIFLKRVVQPSPGFWNCWIPQDKDVKGGEWSNIFLLHCTLEWTWNQKSSGGLSKIALPFRKGDFEVESHAFLGGEFFHLFEMHWNYNYTQRIQTLPFTRYFFGTQISNLGFFSKHHPFLIVHGTSIPTTVIVMYIVMG